MTTAQAMTGRQTPDGITIALNLRSYALITSIAQTALILKATINEVDYYGDAVSGIWDVANTDASSKLVITGLQPGTDYTASISYLYSTGPDVYVSAGTVDFVTAPELGKAHSFKFGLGSCFKDTYLVTAGTIMSTIENSGYAFFLQIGDFGYHDLTNGIRKSSRNEWDTMTTNANVDAMLRAMALYYNWDDHDFGPNDSGKDSPHKDAVAEEIRAYFPHYDTEETFVAGTSGAIYGAFTHGRCRFVMLDNRYHNDDSDAADTSVKKRFGDAQMTWFADEIDRSAADPNIAMTFVVIGVPWVDAKIGQDPDMTVSGSGEATANAAYSVLDEFNGKTRWENSGTSYKIEWSGTDWQIIDNLAQVLYESAEDVLSPNLVGTWSIVGGAGPVPTSVSHGKSYKDRMGSYTHEREFITKTILGRDNGKRIAILSGDMHNCAIDDGSSSNNEGNIPVFHAAPMGNSNSTKGGAYLLGPGQGDDHQFGEVEIIDNGSSMDVIFRAMDETGTPFLTHTETFSIPRRWQSVHDGDINWDALELHPNATTGALDVGVELDYPAGNGLTFDGARMPLRDIAGAGPYTGVTLKMSGVFGNGSVSMRQPEVSGDIRRYFEGFVDQENRGIELDNSADVIEYEIAGLKTDRLYDLFLAGGRFRTDYGDRHTRVSMSGHISAQKNHSLPKPPHIDSPGAPDTVLPGVDDNQVRICTGHPQGAVASWVRIKPPESGIITITQTDAEDTGGDKGYLLTMIRIQESTTSIGRKRASLGLNNLGPLGLRHVTKK